MKNLQTIVVLGLFALVSAKKLPKIPPPREGSVRRAKKGKNSNNDGDRDRSGGYDSCIPLDTVPPGIISATTGRDPNDECLTENKCNTGCCRVYNWLQCDEDNEYYWLECVCNNGAAQPPPVIPGLPTAGDGNRTDTGGGGVIDLPGGGDEGPTVVPIPSDACANVENVGNPFQAEFTRQGESFKACEQSSDCQSAAGDCCASTLCICGPYASSPWGCI